MRGFIEAYEDCVWDVYGFLAYRVRNREDAEDLTQLTFERALAAWDRFDPARASARTWLLTIARNALIDHGRRERSASVQSLSGEDSPEAGLPTEPGPDEVQLGLEPELQRALETLSDREREVIALRFGGDLTGPEIAEMLDLSVANVQQLSSRALRKLRTGLTAGGPASRATGAGARD
jgi:RNA polymerase sigma-70 factor (ECF subfamily)